MNDIDIAALPPSTVRVRGIVSERDLVGVVILLINPTLPRRLDGKFP